MEHGSAGRCWVSHKKSVVVTATQRCDSDLTEFDSENEAGSNAEHERRLFPIMKRLGSITQLAFLTGLLLVMVGMANANTITVSSSMNWSAVTGGSGSGGHIGSGDTVVVTNGATLTIDSSGASCKNMQLGATGGTGNGTLTFSDSTSKLAVGVGTGGILTIGMVGGGTGSINMSSGGWLQPDSITVNNAGTWTPNSAATGATIQVGLGTLTAADLSFFNSFNNLLIAGNSSTTLGGPLIVSGNLEILSYCSLNDIGNYPVSVAGNWISDGTYSHTGYFTPGTSVVTFNGTTAQGIMLTNGTSTSGLTFYNITIANTNAAVGANNNFSVSGTLTVNAGAQFVPLSSVIINSGGAAGMLTGSGTIQVTRTSATADLINQYKFTTYTLNSLTVNYAGAGNQTINNTVGNYGGLQTSGSGTKTLAGATTATNVTLGNGAKLGLTGTSSCMTLWIGSVPELVGSWGSTSSTATHTDDTHFAATSGILNVGVSGGVFGQTSPELDVTGSSVTLKFYGVPGYTYTVERSTNDMATWQDIATITLPNTPGPYSYTDNTGPYTSAFYQLKWVP